MFYRQSHINWKSGKSSRASNQYVPRHLDELNSTVQKNMFVFVCSFFSGKVSWTLGRFFLEHWPWVSSCSQATTRCRCQAALSTVWPLLARSWTWRWGSSLEKNGCHAVSSLKLRVCTWKDWMPMIRRSGGSFLLGEGWHLFRCHQYFQWCNFCDLLTYDFPRLGRQLANFWGPQSLRFHDPIWLMKNH